MRSHKRTGGGYTRIRNARVFKTIIIGRAFDMAAGAKSWLCVCNFTIYGMFIKTCRLYHMYNES